MIMGVDEAGRGPVMGPLVIASASCEDPGVLKRMGVKDSKMLSRKKREMLFQNLPGIVQRTVLIVPASTIDMAREKMTMNRLEVLSFSSTIASHISGRPLIHEGLPDGIVIEGISEGVDVDELILDAADVNEKRFGREIFENTASILGGLRPTVRSFHKADRDYEVVGAASIFAKVTRDRIIDRISEEIGYHVGSGYPSDIHTVRFLSEWVRREGSLPPDCRKSWITSKKILAENLQPTLFSFE